MLDWRQAFGRPFWQHRFEASCGIAGACLVYLLNAKLLKEDNCMLLYRWKMAVKVRMGEKEILQSMKQAVVMLMMAQQEDEENSDEDEDDDADDADDDDEIGDGKPADVLSAQMQSCAC